MREFRIKVNNEKTYVVKANDYNQAVKTLHSKLRDFDDTKKNINVVREFITNNGGKFNKSKDADAILDFIYKKTGVKNADYGDVLYIIRNYTNVKVEDNAVSDSISKYNGEDAIRTNGFVKIKEDGDLTSYKYNGSDFDNAVFKIHQYNPSLIAFVSNGNRTITVRNKYLKDSSIKDVSYVSGKNLKIGQKIVEDGEVLEVVDIKETQRGVNNNYRDVTFKNVKTGATETVHFGNSTLARLNDYSPKYNKGQKFQTSAGIHEIIGYDPAKADVHTNRIEYSYRLKTPNGTYTNIPDWQLEELVKLGRYKLIDSSIQDADPVKVEKIIRKEKSALGITYYLFQTKSSNGATIYYEVTDKSYHGEPTYSGGGIISFSLQSANDSLDSHLLYDKLVSKYGKMAGRKRFFLGKNDSVQRENDASTGYKYRIINNGSKWYYETTFPDGHTTLTGPYSSKQETEQYFHKHRPTEKLTDADPVKVEKIIRKEKSALGITYYIFQTKSSSGYTIYYQVTDKTYHGEPTYSGGGIISLSLKSANDTLDHNLLADKLKAKYGEKEGTKRYLRGENDSAIKDSNIKDAGEEIRYLEGMKFNGVPYTGWAVQHWTDGYYTFDGKKPYIPSGGRDALLSIFKQGGFTGKWKGIQPDKGFESYFRHSTAVPAIKDSDIKDAGFDAEYAEHQRKLDAEVRRAKELHKVNGALDYTTLFKQVFNYKSRGDRLTQLTKTVGDYTYVIYLNNNRILYCVWDKSGNIPKGWCPTVTMYDEYTIKDSNNIRNRKSYTIKVGDKQYKVFAESESEAINKYIKSKKQ